MKITDVEAIVLRQPVLDDGIADGSQDDLVILVHTDEGITGIGEVDSAPEAVRALVEAPGSHAIANSLHDLLVGEDPTDVERLWQKMYRGLIYIGRRGIALHAISGIDIALWDIKGKAEGKPVCELIGTPQRDKVRAYASMLMPDDPGERARARRGSCATQGFTAVKLGWGPLGKDADARRRARRRRGRGGRRRRDDPDRRRPRLRRRREDARSASRASSRSSASSGSRSRSSPTSTRPTPSSPTRSTSASPPASRTRRCWGFRELIERGHVDLVQPDVTRCGGITEMLRIAEFARAHGVETVPHAWKSGIIKAASLHVNAVLPDALFQEYCVADTPINHDADEASGCRSTATAS